MSELDQPIGDKRPTTVVSTLKTAGRKRMADPLASTSLRLGKEEHRMLTELIQRFAEVMPYRNKEVSKSEVVRTLVHYAMKNRWVTDKRLKEAFYEIL